MHDAYLYVHLLAMAYFVGGQLFLVAAVVPALRGNEDREPIRAIARKPGQHVYEGAIFLVSLVIVGLGLSLATT